jgi:Tol biopolymer transport system component
MRTRTGAGLVLAGLLAFARLASAQTEEPTEEPPSAPLPNAHWYTLETPHFEIQYYPEERAFAERAAHYAERAYRLITRYLNWEPSGRVSLTLIDHVDTANGNASSVPFNYINAYGAVPDSLDELSDFDDYVKLLISHEFTHVAHLDTILGWCPRLVNTVLGKIYAPNLSQPTWFIEGLAVLMETRQTTAGRLRSSFFDMHLRVPFLEGKLFDLDAISAIPAAYPQGTAAYLYGSAMLRYIEDIYGPGKMLEISHRYSDECIAGAINRIAGRSVGLGYAESYGEGLWDDWMRSMGHKYALESEEVTKRGITPSRRLTWEAPGPRGEGPGARFLADGTLIYHRGNNDTSPAYVRLDPRTGQQRLVADMQGGGPMSPTPDGRALVFQRVNYLNVAWRIASSPYVAWNDLFRLDVASGSIRRLTRGFRAHEPDVAPDGSQIACVVGGTGSRKLAVVPIEGGVPRVLSPEIPGLAYTPAFSPDGRLIAYSRWMPGGYRDIHIYDLATGTDRALAHDRAMDLDPRFTPDGRYLLYASDRNGIYDVYAYELATERLYQVTNVLGGAFQPTVSPDGRTLVFTGFESEGFDLYAMPFDPARFLAAQPYANARLDSPTDPDAETDSPDARPEDKEAVPFVTRTRGYQPWKYMYPRVWTVSVLNNPLGLGQTLDLSTTVNDPVGIHFISADVLIPTQGQPSAAIGYTYNRFWPSLSLSARRTSQEVNGLFFQGANLNYRQLVVGVSGAVGLPVLNTADAWADITFGYDYTAYGNVDAVPVADPTAPITVLPERGPDADVYVQWRYNNVHSWQYSISGQEGRYLQLYLRWSDPALGGRFHTTQLSWSWAEYWTPPWARLHALALLYAGGIGIGDKRIFFSLGGFVQQDLVRALFLNQRECCQFLRGYPHDSFFGDAFQLVSAEYRAPLVWIERGYSTFPLYLRRIWGSIFTDAGNAYQGAFHASDLKVDVGAEAHLQFNLAYFLESQLQLGYARALSTPKGDQIYLVAAANF